MGARGSRVQGGTRSVPRQGDAPVHRAVERERGPRRVPRRHGRHGQAQGVAEQAERRPLGRDPLARRVGRPRRHHRAASHLHAGDGEVPRARHLQRQRHRADRPVDHRVGHRRPEGALAARHPRRDRTLVPGILRAASRLRHGEPAHHRDPLRRRLALRRQRSEDLDQLRADREVGPVLDAHRSRPRSSAAASTKASPRSSSTWSCRASTSARSARSPATRCSAKCS